MRVAAGGHNIPEETIHRRYKRSLENFFKLYSPLVHNWELFDNTCELYLVAKNAKGKVTIHDEKHWQFIRNTVKLKV